jgi:putative endonuclease
LVEVRPRADARHGGAASRGGGVERASLVLAARHRLLRFAASPACRLGVVATDAGEVQSLRGTVRGA